MKRAIFYHFDPHFWPLECPKMDQDMMNDKRYLFQRISIMEKLTQWKFEPLTICFHETGNFWPFWPPFDPWGAKKWVKTCDLTEINATIEFLSYSFATVPNLGFKWWVLGKLSIWPFFGPFLIPRGPQKYPRGGRENHPQDFQLYWTIISTFHQKNQV